MKIYKIDYITAYHNRCPEHMLYNDKKEYPFNPCGFDNFVSEPGKRRYFQKSVII